MGFLQDAEQAFCKESIPWNKATQQLLGTASSSEDDLIKAISAKTTFADNDQKHHILGGLRWLGIFSSEKVSIALCLCLAWAWQANASCNAIQAVDLLTPFLKITPRGNPLDTLCATLEQKMQYAEGERDLVM